MARLLTLLSVATALSSCEHGEETSVDVWLDSDPTLLSRASILRVVVRSAPELSPLDTGDHELASLSLPARAHLVPMDAARDRRWALEAYLLDEGGTELARVAAHGAYVDGRALEVRLRFEDACGAGLDCMSRETCRGGACMDACLVPAEPGASATPCALADAGRPDAGDLDAGGSDAGDAGELDAGDLDAGADGGVGDSGSRDGGAHVPVYELRELASSAVTSSTFTEVLAFTLPARSHQWLLFVTARLEGEPATTARSAELEYRVDGTTRGAGTAASSDASGTGGPFVHFDLLASGAHTISVRARTAGTRVTVRDLAVVALPIAAGGVLAYDDAPAVQGFTAVSVDLASASTSAAGDALVLGATMAGALMSTRGFPSEVRLAVAGTDLPATSAPGAFLGSAAVEESPAIVIASHQGVAAGASVRIVGRSPGGSGFAEHSRVLVLDADRAFATLESSTPVDRTLSAGASATVATLTTASRGAGVHDTVFLSLAEAWSSDTRELSFGPGAFTFTHALDSSGARLVYGRAGARSVPGTSTFTLGATAGTAGLSLQRAAVYAIGLE